MQKLLLWFSLFGLLNCNVMAESLDATGSLGQLVPELEKEQELETLKNNRNQGQMTILPDSGSIFPKSSLFSRENHIFNNEGFFVGKSYQKKSLDKPYPTSVDTGGVKNIFPKKEREFKIPKEVIDAYQQQGE